MKKTFLVLLLLFSLQVSASPNPFKTILSFDFDETLAQSNHLTKKNLILVKEQGYQVRTTKKGQDYIIRPGTEELLEFAQGQGFELMIFTHNYRDYAIDILDDSGLSKYFTKVKAHEDVVKSYNHDYRTYPYHRNITYPQKSYLRNYTVDLYSGFFKNLFLDLIGNKNIVPYIPCTDCAKYPPLYGSRVHVDNAFYHVDRPVDFVGIHVDDFYALKPEAQDKNGNYIWAEKIKNDILKVKRIGWIEFYRQKYSKDPVLMDVLVREEN
jgi:hypothetical protein